MKHKEAALLKPDLNYTRQPNSKMSQSLRNPMK